MFCLEDALLVLRLAGDGQGAAGRWILDTGMPNVNAASDYDEELQQMRLVSTQKNCMLDCSDKGGLRSPQVCFDMPL